MHERIEINANTGEVVTHRLCACLDEYNRSSKVTWMDFIKVARSEEKASGDDGDDNYGKDDGVKF